MHTALIITFLFAGLLNCAYTAPPTPTKTGNVLQELRTVLEQSTPSEQPSENQEIDFLCKVVGEKQVAVPNNGQVKSQAIFSTIAAGVGIAAGGRSLGWWERAQQQETAEVVGLACTPVKVNSNGEVTFLTRK